MSAIHKRGFASMDKQTLLAICVAGGKKAHAIGKAHQWTKAEASAAGKKGVLAREARKRAKTAA